jgi:hypothetical protein
MAADVQYEKYDSTHHFVSYRPTVRGSFVRRHRTGNALGQVFAGGRYPPARTNLFRRRDRSVSARDRARGKRPDDRTYGHRLSCVRQFRDHRIDRLVREVRSALHRRKREESAARRAIAEQMNSEMRETLTAMLLSCELAMSVPDVPGSAAEKIRTIDNLARELRLRLEVN